MTYLRKTRLVTHLHVLGPRRAMALSEIYLTFPTVTSESSWYILMNGKMIRRVQVRWLKCNILFPF